VECKNPNDSIFVFMKKFNLNKKNFYVKKLCVVKLEMNQAGTFPGIESGRGKERRLAIT